MTKNKTNDQNPQNNEITLAFHLIRKSANSLVEDLRYFNQTPKHFSEEQIANILGQIEAIEEYFGDIRRVFRKKILG